MSEEWKVNHVRELQNLLQIVKYTDTASCSPFQLSYLTIMKDRFLLTSLPLVFSSSEIEWAKDDKEATYLSLFQNVALEGNFLSFDEGCTYGMCLDTLWPLCLEHQIYEKPHSKLQVKKLLSIPIVIPKNNEGQVLATSLTNYLFFNRNHIGKRGQECCILTLIPKCCTPEGGTYGICLNTLWPLFREHQIQAEPQSKRQVKKIR